MSGIGFSLASSRTTGKASQKAEGTRTGTSAIAETTAQENIQKGITTRTGEKAGTTRGTTTTAGESSTESGQALTSVLSSLDEGTQKRLQDIVAGLGDPVQAEALQAALSGRALSADQDLAGQTNAIIAAATARGERAIGKAQTQLAKGAGSTQNTLVQQIGLEADVDLQTELAALQSSLEIERRQIATAELTGAAQSQVSGVSALSTVLKGAEQTSEQQQTTTQLTKTQQVQEALQSLFETSSDTEIQDLIAKLTGTTDRVQTIDEAFTKSGSGDSSASNLSGGITGNLGF